MYQLKMVSEDKIADRKNNSSFESLLVQSYEHMDRKLEDLADTGLAKQLWANFFNEANSG